MLVETGDFRGPCCFRSTSCPIKPPPSVCVSQDRWTGGDPGNYKKSYQRTGNKRVAQSKHPVSVSQDRWTGLDPGNYKKSENWQQQKSEEKGQSDIKHGTSRKIAKEDKRTSFFPERVTFLPNPPFYLLYPCASRQTRLVCSVQLSSNEVYSSGFISSHVKCQQIYDGGLNVLGCLVVEVVCVIFFCQQAEKMHFIQRKKEFLFGVVKME